MKQVFLKNGEAIIEDVPAPMAAPGEVLVRVYRSCISVGTEMSGLKSSSEPIWKRALKRPDKVIKALNMMATKGVNETMNVIRGQLGAGLVVGYSAAGEVIGLGEGVDNVEIGMRVACAGAQSAHHAEIIRVPVNLTVPLPDNVSYADAATVTMGAIAMQGVRRIEPTLGECFVVVGQGLLGQITTQILKANGCYVVATDVDDARLTRAKELGADVTLKAGDEAPVKKIAQISNGVGVDGVIVTAASSDSALLGGAFKLCRRKGRVVLVGDVPIQIDRADIYRNEIDFRISTSYGPGRYDRRYEEEGLDYPVSYVRWTENRNMLSYLSLISDGKVQPSKLIDRQYAIHDAGAAYASLKAEGERPLGIVLTYTENDDEFQGILSKRTVATRTGLAKKDGPVQVGVVSPGAFLQGTHLPNMSAMSEAYQIRAVMSRTAHAASTVATNQRASYSTTDYSELLADTDVDLILIGSRHDVHGTQVIQALEAGKHVFVEKPLTLDREELAKIADIIEKAGEKAPVLLTGYNRRFAPGVAKIREKLKDRQGPMIIDYRMNAGHIPLDHWVHGKEGGGRNLGEACHIYDLFTALSGSEVEEISALSIVPKEGMLAKNDNFVATIRFKNGDIAKLTYTALGNSSWPKEQMNVYCDQEVYFLDDYNKVIGGKEQEELWSGSSDKGHKAEIAALYEALSGKADWPIPMWQQLQVSNIAFAVEEAIK
ncbi:bi-domain-containing oxidoreductase [Terasakiella pusilla]|uniref:bi-domain-containing oxidoreductase n=1 Tax=Terasakiella pusilla TaxID=64973 RepID=UPI00049139BF|nr:bi-domain-containing oxidoreductase [Terasakiella pusilla]